MTAVAFSKPVKREKQRKPLRAKRWGVSRRVSKAETRGAKRARPPVSVERRKGKRASAQLRGGVRCSGDLSASGASLAFPRPQKKLGTKHSRRPRELGYMAFCKDRGCELALERDSGTLFGVSHRCWGFRVARVVVEFAHLGYRRRYDTGDIGAGLCSEVHHGIDGREGGKAPWYVALGRRGQELLRMHLSNRARRAWNALTPRERDAWDERAKAQLADIREARRLEARS